MKSRIVAKAYAKVNFNLKVLPKREDGYHSIESIFQTIDVYDELTVDFVEEKGCHVTCDAMQLPQVNTLTLAYEAFCQTCSCNVPGVEIFIKKGIPAGGGLGGGSSDAAALIRVLEKRCGINLSDLQLDYIASKTGSDVFFFMHCDSDGKGCALVSGRGEVIKKIDSRTDLHLVVIFPDVSSSTKEAYSLVDKMIESGKNIECPFFEKLEVIYRKDPSEWTFKNTFTPALTEKYSEIKEALEMLKTGGADYAEMSGSGSTVFGVFADEHHAFFCGNLLAQSFKSYHVRTI